MLCVKEHIKMAHLLSCIRPSISTYPGVSEKKPTKILTELFSPLKLWNSGTSSLLISLHGQILTNSSVIYMKKEKSETYEELFQENDSQSELE